MKLKKEDSCLDSPFTKDEMNEKLEDFSKKFKAEIKNAPTASSEDVFVLHEGTKVVILDEPFANLDPTTQIRLKQIIKELAEKQDVTVLVSSHDLIHVTEVCERIVVLNKGQVVNDIQTSTETLKELEVFFAG